MCARRRAHQGQGLAFARAGLLRDQHTLGGQARGTYIGNREAAPQECLRGASFAHLVHGREVGCR